MFIGYCGDPEKRIFFCRKEISIRFLSFNLCCLLYTSIGSFPEIPCINRNPMGCANAITMANLAIGGYDAVIPLDEVIVTMRVVGESLPKELRCGSGGLCGSPTGKCLAEKLEMCIRDRSIADRLICCTSKLSFSTMIPLGVLWMILSEKLSAFSFKKGRHMDISALP